MRATIRGTYVFRRCASSGSSPEARRISRSRARARLRRDFTVPSGSSAAAATSSYASPCTSESSTTSRHSSGSCASASSSPAPGPGLRPGAGLDRVDRGHVGVVALLVERALRAALAAAQLVASRVGDDPQQPGAKALTAEAVERPIGAEEGLLGHVLGGLARAQEAERQRVRRVLVPDHQRVEGRELPALRPLDEVRAVVVDCALLLWRRHGWPCSLRPRRVEPSTARPQGLHTEHTVRACIRSPSASKVASPSRRGRVMIDGCRWLEAAS